MTRSTAATIVALLLFATTAVLTSTVLAQSDDDEPPVGATIQMRLTDQTFDLEPDGSIELTYELSGALAAVADLTPPTTAPPTTAPPTTAPPTTAAPTTTSPTTTVPPVPDEQPDPNADVPLTAAPTAAPTTAAPTTTLPPPVPIIAGVVNYAPLDDPSDLRGTIGPEPPVARFGDAIDGVDLPDVRSSITVDDDGTARLSLSVPTDRDPSIAERLRFDDSGLHPIVVQLRIGDAVVASHATVVEFRARPTDGPPPVSLSLLAAVDDPGLAPDSGELADAVDDADDLLSVATAIDAPISFRIPPSVADEPTVDDVASDELANDELLTSPFTPFDVSSAVAVDRVDAFVDDLIAGEEALRDALPTIPLRREVWLATTPLSGAAAEELRGLGVRYLAMPPAVYRSSVAAEPDAPLPAVDRIIGVPLPSGGTMPVLLVDDELGAEFTTERTDAVLDDVTATEWAVDTIAALRLEQMDAPFTERDDARSHLLATPDLGAPDPRLIRALERFADRSHAIDFVPASLLGSVTDTQTLPEPGELPTTAGPSLETRLNVITLVRESLADAASMLPGGDEQLAEWDEQLETLITTAYSEADVQAILTELQERAETIRSAVVAPDPFTFTLTGPSSIDVRIRNRLDEPVVVVLRMTSARLDFPDGDQTVTLAPNDTTVVPVRVEPRSNGTSAVTVDILTPRDRPLVDPVTLTSRVTALTGLGQVLTGALVLILVTWWISHWRTRRREDTPDDGDAAIPADG